MFGLLKNLVKHAVRTTGFELVRTGQAGHDTKTIRPDIDHEDGKILIAVRPFTMTSEERILALIDAVRYLVKHKIEGAMVECGVWKGGSMMATCLALLQAEESSRDIFLYDTFTGMTQPTDIDRSYDGSLAAEQLRNTVQGTGVWCEASLDEVRANLLSTNYPAAKIRFVSGPVEKTIPDTMPSTIALLRLDTDWYESTRHELLHLYPKLVSGGILIVDDYGHWQGSRRAVDEYFAASGNRIFLHRVDYTGRLAVKSESKEGL